MLNIEKEYEIDECSNGELAEYSKLPNINMLIIFLYNTLPYY